MSSVTAIIASQKVLRDLRSAVKRQAALFGRTKSNTPEWLAAELTLFSLETLVAMAELQHSLIIERTVKKLPFAETAPH